MHGNTKSRCPIRVAPLLVKRMWSACSWSKVMLWDVNKSGQSENQIRSAVFNRIIRLVALNRKLTWSKQNQSFQTWSLCLIDLMKNDLIDSLLESLRFIVWLQYNIWKRRRFLLKRNFSSNARNPYFQSKIHIEPPWERTVPPNTVPTKPFDLWLVFE